MKCKLYYFLILCLIYSCNKKPLEAVSTQKNHYNHQIFEENKLAPRASFFAFENTDISKKENSKRFLSLNGNWKFNWVKDPKKRPTTFQNIDFDDSDWKTIPVPANWEVEGFGKPIYLDERYPFTTKWPNAPEDYNPVGTYRKEITLNKDFLSEDIILHFAAAKSAMYVYINGNYVGYSQGSKTPAEFNIIKHLKAGKNLIALQLFRWSDASYLESQDMLRMSGIERDIYLYTRPKIFISDYYAKTTLDNSYKNGIFNGTFSIKNNTNKEVTKNITVSLKDKFKETSNFLSLNAIPILTNVEEDSIDCLCIDETFSQYDVLRMGIEFERILRLNSYVLLLQNKLLDIPKTFTNAYLAFIRKHHNEGELLVDLPKQERLESFYNNGFTQQKFKNQQWLNWSMLEQYYQTALEKESLSTRPSILTELKELFEQFEQEGEVHLEYETYLYYGLFNHSVPEISLRKSIFFNVLRPVAFAFYILVKANIYFWKGLYKIKNKLFQGSRS